MISRIYNVKISTIYSDWPFAQQTPNKSLCWDNYRFYINNDDIKECDYWIIYEGLEKAEEINVSASNVLLITAEPPNFKRYSNKFIQQFHTVRCAHKYLKHSNIISSHPALPWHVGRRVRGEKNLSFDLPYDKLIKNIPNKKTGLLSTITSNKSFTSEHRARIEFVKKLESRFVGKLKVYGRGIRDITDKWNAIAPYKYHIVIENGCFEDYWTEKISDAFLANTFPFYIGCPNLKDYFPEGSYMELDINDIEGAYKKIEFAIENNYYEKSSSARSIARDLCLNKYNLFPEIVDWCKKNPVKNKKPLKIYPENVFKEIPRAVFNLKSWIALRYYKLRYFFKFFL